MHYSQFESLSNSIYSNSKWNGDRRRSFLQPKFLKRDQRQACWQETDQETNWLFHKRYEYPRILRHHPHHKMQHSLPSFLELVVLNPQTKKFTLGEKATELIAFKWPYKVWKQMPVLASHKDTVLSPEPVNSVFVKGWKPITFTESAWPRNDWRHRPLFPV